MENEWVFQEVWWFDISGPTTYSFPLIVFMRQKNYLTVIYEKLKYIFNIQDIKITKARHKSTDQRVHCLTTKDFTCEWVILLDRM